MRSVKMMLFGIAIMIFLIVLHLFFLDFIITDIFVLFALPFVFIGLISSGEGAVVERAIWNI